MGSYVAPLIGTAAVQGPTSKPDDDGQVATYNADGSFEGWVTPIASDGDGKIHFGDSGNVYYDTNNDRLKVGAGVRNPVAPLHVRPSDDSTPVAVFQASFNAQVEYQNSGGQTVAWISCGNGNAEFGNVTVTGLTLTSGNHSVARGYEYRLNGYDPNFGMRMATAADSPPGIAYVDLYTADGIGGNSALRYRMSLGDNESQKQTRWEVRANGQVRHSLQSSTQTREVARTVPSFVVDTDASRTPRIVHEVCDWGGWRETFREESDGSSARLGFFGADAVARPTVTGSWSDSTAGASLAAALASLGLITDETTE